MGEDIETILKELSKTNLSYLKAIAEALYFAEQHTEQSTA
ncbi:hypothetical protein AGMMS49975_23560 [Clostridia bacterium]|nr:hypothetical protein AGMMS49975_23560 [Clostridia bacterium]